MTVETVARLHHKQQADRARQATLLAMRRWERLDVGSLRGSWAEQSPLVTAIIMRAQQASAAQAEPFHAAVMAEHKVTPRRTARINAFGFASSAADGRDLESLVWQPLFYTEMLISEGVAPEEALYRGGLTLGLIAGQETRDAGRVADGVASFTDEAVGGYVRYLNLPSCPRCVVLAGKFYLRSAGFERHPRCDCVHVSVPKGSKFAAAWTERQEPSEIAKDGQITGLSQADQKAIADGADLNQVINAHRGMSTAQVYGRRLKVTTEGTTKRGFAGQRLGDFAKAQAGMYARSRSPRLMPESIYKIADDDAEALRLLKRFGYLI